ncbi:MAG: DUF268 domain-containing protein [Planctomycetes bacterium]|nr:DUF268 domain-containing protein [Planctomycetota bacterium]
MTMPLKRAARLAGGAVSRVGAGMAAVGQRLRDLGRAPVVGQPRDLSGDRHIEWSFVAAHVPPGPGRALDFGPGGSFLSLVAAHAGHEVVAVDLLPCQWTWEHPALTFHQGDLRASGLAARSFDLIVNCSTVEHVGLAGRYGVASAEQDGDLDAMTFLRSLMKPGGVMLLTVPVGRDAVFPPLHRVYGPERLPRLLAGLLVEHEQHWVKNATNRWTSVGRDEALARQPEERLYGLGCFVLRAST